MQCVIEGRILSRADWHRAGLLLLAGVIAHFLYLMVLSDALPMEQWNWMGGDTESYLRPAKSFLETGTFAREGVPDYRRSIGYPLFLAGCLKLADMLGTEWRQTLYSLQAVLFAGAYPAIFLIGRLLFGLQRRQALWGVAFIGLAGGFVSYVPVILTDGLFALVLVAGVACGLISLASSGRGWLWGGAHIGLIMYAANVRPMLAFFPVAALCAHWALLREDRWKTNLNEKKTVALIMFAVTIIGVQTPALRNWFFNGVFTPSEIGSINLYDYLAYDVLKFRGDTARYETIERRLDQLEGPEHVQDRIELRKKEALAVFRESPGVTAGHLIYYTVLNSIETHWQNLFYLWKKTWYRDYEDGSVVWSPLPFLLATAWIVVYGNLYGIALFALLCKSKELLVMGAVIFFLIPYGFCGTSYQGARFRLWLEPFIVLFVFTIVPYYIRRYREGRMLIDGR